MLDARKKTLSLFNQYEKLLVEDQSENNHYYMRALISVYLFDFLDRLRLNNFRENWYLLLENEMEQLKKHSDFIRNSFDLSLNNFNDWKLPDQAENIESKTGEVYFNLWKDFKKDEYFKQTAEYLNERFEKNKISVKGMYHALDDGCGGGRYTLALKALGCKKVTGIDISHNSINLAKKMNPYSDGEVEFLQGSVLELPFEDNSFDFVFSNGVLHHTMSTETGLSEIYRVLKPKATCWLYLYGGKETLFWDIVDFSRKLLADVPQNYVQALMRVMGYPPGRIFHRTDFFYVPMNRRYFIFETEQMLKDTGFSDFRKLNRGIGFDWDEIIFSNPEIDPYIYGEGEMRYLITK